MTGFLRDMPSGSEGGCFIKQGLSKLAFEAVCAVGYPFAEMPPEWKSASCSCLPFETGFWTNFPKSSLQDLALDAQVMDSTVSATLEELKAIANELNELRPVFSSCRRLWRCLHLEAFEPMT